MPQKGSGSDDAVAILSTDLSGYLKLDQTTPQTTVGTFTFPSVGIGTASPVAKIHASIDGNTPSSTLYTAGSDNVVLSNNGNSYLRLVCGGTNATPAFFGIHAGTSVQAPSATLNNYTTFLLGGQGYIAGGRQSNATVSFATDGNPNNALPGRIVFNTTNSGQPVLQTGLTVDSLQRVFTGSTTCRGSFDAGGVVQINSNPATITITATYGAGNYVADGSTMTYRVYSYKTGGSALYVYSPNYKQGTFTLDSSARDVQLNISWAAVTGADGYRVVMDNAQFEVGYGMTAYQYAWDLASPTVAFIDGDGTEGLFFAGNALTPNNTTLVNTGLYVETNTGIVKMPGDATCIGKVTAGNFQIATAPTANSTGAGAILYRTATPTTNSGWLPIKDNTGTTRYIPYWA